MGQLEQLGDRLLVLYDGHCVLCNRSVRWLLRRDRHDRLRFAPAQSAAVAPLLAQCGFDPATAPSSPSSPFSPDTILVLRHPGAPAQTLLTRSSAAVALLAELPRPWPAVAALLRMVPRPLRDLGYRIVARCRYRLWGRLPVCPLPSPQEQPHFLSSAAIPPDSC